MHEENGLKDGAVYVGYHPIGLLIPVSMYPSIDRFLFLTGEREQQQQQRAHQLNAIASLLRGGRHFLLLLFTKNEFCNSRKKKQQICFWRVRYNAKKSIFVLEAGHGWQCL